MIIGVRELSIQSNIFTATELRISGHLLWLSLFLWESDIHPISTDTKNNMFTAAKP